MSNTFNFSRFGKYLAFDLKSRWAEQRVFLLTFALIPFIFYLLYIFFSGMGQLAGTPLSEITLGRPVIAMRAGVFSLSAIAFLILYPSRAYGFLTEKARGSAWIELPASRFEKFLSMLLICLVIVPVAFFVIYLIGDALVCLADKQCGEGIFSAWLRENAGNADVRIGGNGIWLFASWALQVSSIFLLGALLFKKSKVTKTILALFIVFMVVFAITVLAVSSMDISDIGERAQLWVESHADNMDFWINFWGNAELILVVGGLGLWSWLKIKHLQH